MCILCRIIRSLSYTTLRYSTVILFSLLVIVVHLIVHFQYILGLLRLKDWQRVIVPRYLRIRVDVFEREAQPSSETTIFAMGAWKPQRGRGKILCSMTAIFSQTESNIWEQFTVLPVLES